MLPLFVLCLCGPAQLIAKQTPLSMARRTVSISGNGGRVFREEGVWNYSTMLLREDLGVLILGAREAIFALDLSDISQKKDMVKWQVTHEMQDKCSHKGKNLEIECQNYIRILHKMDDGRMYVCGTNAFSPTCDYMSYIDSRLTLENKREDGKGKCPFDPFQRHASELVDGVLFSATSINFLGSEPVVMRSFTETIRTDFKTSWLNEPNFIGMEHIAEGEHSPEGDDDKIYLFFSETAVEYDSYSKLEVSRVARVCKSDMGGQRTLQRKWTSFVKARLDCPVADTSLPFIIKDAFRFCPGDWKTCIFYAVFTPQAYTSQSSAVCAYSIADIRQVFSEGKFKTPVPVETSFVKWVMYSGDVPFPRPGACINNEARDKGFSQSLDLPDKTLQFIRDRPLMDQAVLPISEQPLLIKQGAAFTRIVVASTVALDGSTHQVMFIGTENGSVLKGVTYNGHTFVIEEVQMFQPTQPVKTLRLSNSALYAGSEVAAAQMPLSSCGQYQSCLDCVLARDPYCGWNLPTKQCIAVSSVHQDPHSDVIQSLTDGDATRCPPIESSKAVNMSFLLGNTVKLSCQPDSNLAHVEWQVDSRPVISSDAYQINPDGLLILNASAEASGLYTCRSVESSNSQDYVTRRAAYKLRLASGQACQSEEATVLLPQAQTKQNTVVALQIMVILLSIMLAALVIWNSYKGHFTILGRRCTQEQEAEGGRECAPTLELLRTADGKIQREGSSSSNSKNHNRRSEGKNTDQQIT